MLTLSGNAFWLSEGGAGTQWNVLLQDAGIRLYIPFAVDQDGNPGGNRLPGEDDLMPALDQSDHRKRGPGHLPETSLVKTFQARLLPMGSGLKGETLAAVGH